MEKILNYHILMNYAHILTTAPAGASVQKVIQAYHDMAGAVPDADKMISQGLLYAAYHALHADAQAMELCGTANDDLAVALHGASVLEELREGTACYTPTGEITELTFLSPELKAQWCDEISSNENMETLIFVTMEILMAQTHSFPFALETLQYLMTYRLAISMEQSKEHYPRKETARTVKLSKYAIPWERTHSAAYLCCVDGEVFLLDGDLDDGSFDDYLCAIRQAEEVVPHENLKRYLIDRIAEPCFDFELEKAVNFWLGDERKEYGRRAEPSDAHEASDK